MKKIKICFLLPSHWSGSKGGAELQVKYILEYFQSTDRFEIHYICRNYRASLGSEFVHLVPKGIFSKYCKFVDKDNILNLLNMIQPEFIYQRVVSAYTGIAAKYCSTGKAQLILHIAHTADVEPPKLKFGKKLLFDIIENHYINIGLNNADYIICQTQDQADLLKRNFSKTCSLLMPNVSPDLSEADIAKDSDKKIVLWVANIKPLKGPEAFLSIAKAFSGHSRLEFHMAGKVNSQYAKNIESKAMSIRNMVFHGEISFEEVNHLMAKASLFVNTSRAEGFPNTFIQAWLNETPVVSLFVDPDHLLEENALGIFCHGDLDLLIREMANLLEPNVDPDFGKKSRSFALKKFSIENVGDIVSLIDRNRVIGI